MELLLYSCGGESAARLEKVVRQALSTCSLVTCQSLESFGGALCRNRSKLQWVIIHAETMDEFEKILERSEWFEGLKVVFIIPDRKIEIIRRAHALYPRLIGFKNDDYSDVKAVIAHVERRFLNENCF